MLALILLYFTKFDSFTGRLRHSGWRCAKTFFSERIIRVWNSLPPSIVSFDSLLSFKNSLGNANLSIHTKYWWLFFYYRCI